MTMNTDQKLRDLLQDFGVAMLVTRSPQGQLRSRPMALVEVEPNGTLWLLTDRHSGKLEEIMLDRHVNVSAQSSTKFLSISGQAVPVEDRRKISELWKESFKIWFPGGKEDPSLVLIKIEGEAGEYWDNGGVSGIKYLLEAGRAYLTGTRAQFDEDPKMHAKVNL